MTKMKQNKPDHMQSLLKFSGEPKISGLDDNLVGYPKI